MSAYYRMCGDEWRFRYEYLTRKAGIDVACGPYAPMYPGFAPTMAEEGTPEAERIVEVDAAGALAEHLAGVQLSDMLYTTALRCTKDVCGDERVAAGCKRMFLTMRAEAEQCSCMSHQPPLQLACRW